MIRLSTGCSIAGTALRGAYYVQIWFLSVNSFAYHRTNSCEGTGWERHYYAFQQNIMLSDGSHLMEHMLALLVMQLSGSKRGNMEHGNQDASQKQVPQGALMGASNHWVGKGDQNSRFSSFLHRQAVFGKLFGQLTSALCECFSNPGMFLGDL